MTDTHTHLYMPEYEDGGEGAVRDALAGGVKRLVFPAVDISSLEQMKALHSRFRDNTYMAIGLHPTEVDDKWKENLDAMETILAQDRSSFVAIGETGIDLYWDATRTKEQQESFSRQYDWALQYNLPLIIHCRSALEKVLEIISSKDGRQPLMIFHSFTGAPEDVTRIREVCDPYFGINGVVTFKNAQSLRDAIPLIGLGRIVLETDSPYLAPVPKRGRRNESSYLGFICEKVGEVLGKKREEIEFVTDSNATDIFNFK